MIFDEPLPWDHLDCTVSKAFLKREWEQAVEANLTSDCRRGPCKGCNVCPELNTAIIDYKEGGRVEKSYVLALNKGEKLRFLSHLDYAQAVERMIRRAEIKMAYSEGFNPHMKISFSSALALGVTAAAEYIDMDVLEEDSLESIWSV